MVKDEFGVWSCYVAPKDGKCAIPHDSMVKVCSFFFFFHAFWKSSSRCTLIPHDRRKQVSFTLPNGTKIDRLPPWIKRVTQDLSISPIYDARFWNPPKEEQYVFKHGRKGTSKENENGGLKIYEAHSEDCCFPAFLARILKTSWYCCYLFTVGISTPEPKVGTYKEFEKNLLPRIKELGYNCIQMWVLSP
jgi:1,4-alpha-glucan branching enzyme